MFGLELPDPENAQTKSSNMTELSACFREYCKEEEIGGDDQWYCNKCKEHRDITK
jgi:ubiquitin C-terminal hydrolase